MISYCLVRLLGWIVGCLPYRVIHGLGRICGTLIYVFYRPMRKKAMSNLAIAYGETLSEKQRLLLARRSLQNLMITCLEFFRLSKSRHNLNEILTMVEPEKVTTLQERGQGIVFLTGHQANWEIPFLAINSLSPGGVAIGRPIKNRRLYRFILSIREMNGGKIVLPKHAIKAGLKALKGGKYIGIVGDQAFPESDYSYPLFGTRAWTSNAPALLAYKTHSPIIVGTTRRIKNRYEMRGSDPLWPDYSKPLKEAVDDLMNRAMAHLEESIKQAPDQWMWIHDRWKQQGIDHVKRKYRFGFVLILLPHNFDPKLPARLRAIFPRSFLTFYVPQDHAISTDCEVRYYSTTEELLIRDWRYQLVLDFIDLPHVRRHFRKLGAVKALHLLPETTTPTLVKPECLPTVTI